MKNLRACVMSIVMASAVAACGGDGGGGSGPVTPAQAQELCQAGCEKDATCDPNSGVTVEQCTASCVDDAAGGAFRGDAFEAITDCALGLTCGTDESVCLRECVPTSSHERYEARCREFGTMCGITDPAQLDSACETTPNGDDLGFFCLLTPAVIDEFTACFTSSSCQTVQACFDAAAARYGLD